MRRSALVALVLLGLLTLGGVGAAVAVSLTGPSLRAVGPTSVAGTDGTAVFEVADRTIRQVRYDDGGTLRYTFDLVNDGRLPVRVLGLDDEQADPRLFSLDDLTARDLGPGESTRVTLSLGMSGCETLSSRAGSFVQQVVVRTRRAGVFEDTVTVALPEELHTGSPREAFCPDATAKSRPPG